MGTRWLRILLAMLLLLAAFDAESEGKAPRRFCYCPEHPQPVTAASLSAGSSYKLFAYDDAYQVPSHPGLWCYTRAVWFEAVHAAGRFEWTASGREVMSGAIHESTDVCDGQNHFEWLTPPNTGESTITHGAQLDSSREIPLYYAKPIEFKPTWVARLKTLASSLIGFGQLSLPTPPSRIAIRVSSTVSGNAPPFTVTYTIESSTGTSFNVLPIAQTQPWAAQYPRLHWEAAASPAFYAEMERQNKGFVDGGARTTAVVTAVRRVEPAVGRLLLLPPNVAPPAPNVKTADAILIGYASAFRVVPVAVRHRVTQQ